MTEGASRDTYGGYRARLVEQLRAQGIRDLAVLRAFAATPRHLFVPEAVRHRAYEDAALPIGVGQTISQPFTQARYLEALGLSGRERVLEIGTGSGYQTALLAALADQVFTIERMRPLPPPLAEQLASGGRMVIPLGAKGAQTLTLVRRTAEGIRTSPIGEARFVPLVGEHGFDA
ncbi:MAG: hypothetical protein AUG85_13885 [Gemmatimonadetes bacterium 13_1_20CM_4_66_11]|nr:MAG: hypothetical protein AUG85_13885 [Gemmatimonadetes bacterium 13_1_20CM_4_66_11]